MCTLTEKAAVDYMANNGETPMSVALACGNTKLNVLKLLRYFTEEPTWEHSATMAVLMLKELVVYHHLECSIVDIKE